MDFRGRGTSRLYILLFILYVGIVDCVGVVIGVGSSVNGKLIERSKTEGLGGCKACGPNGRVDRAIDGMIADLEVLS